ncbi:hypothetical protein ACH5RR_002756 [Cinchona calisaya]|uniref:NAC domain-containing protein n=1 Tax=Cinchona calisaya TaxID=153742 RepID=A0ABD3ASV2_9GENT
MENYPAGYRFSPSDEELLVEYLTKQINKEPLDRPHIQITEVDIYEYNPKELTETYKLARNTEWYFFTPRNKKYLNGSRPDRNAGDGHWKPTSNEEAVIDKERNIVGFKRTLTFFMGLEKDKNSKKTDWLMQEYKLQKNSTPRPDCKKLDDCVLVKIYKKRGKANKEEENQNAVDEIGPPNNSGDLQPFGDLGHIVQIPLTLQGIGDIQPFLGPNYAGNAQPRDYFQDYFQDYILQAPTHNQASFLPPFRSPISSVPPFLGPNNSGNVAQPNENLAYIARALIQNEASFQQPFPSPTSSIPLPPLVDLPPLPQSFNSAYDGMGLYCTQNHSVCSFGPQHNQVNQSLYSQPPHTLGQSNPERDNGGGQSGDLGLNNEPLTIMVDDYSDLMDELLRDEEQQPTSPTTAFPPPQQP